MAQHYAILLWLAKSEQWVSNPVVLNNGTPTICFFPISFVSVFSAAGSSDTPNSVLRIGNVTAQSLEFSLTQTGYTTTTCRAIILGK